MTTTPPDNAGLADGLDHMRRTILHWMEYDKKNRDAEGLETTDATHIMCPPTWPSYGMLKHWAAALGAATALRPSVWMDISTAPKDGSEVLAVDQCGDQYILRWHDGDWMEQGCCRPEWTVTHWMPLPTPPKAPTP